MKKSTFVVAFALLLLTLGAHAEVVSSVRLWTAQATNTTTFQPTPSGAEVQVTVVGNSTPDGTVTTYTCPTRATAGCVAVATYATPTTARTYVGTSSPFLYVTLTGNTTGNVDVYVIVKN